MRKLKKLVILLIMLSLVACESKETLVTTKMETKNQIEAIIDEQVAKLEESNLDPVLNETSDFEDILKEARNKKIDSDVSYDLTKMNKDMIYATVYLFMTEPDEFIGETVRVRGEYLKASYEENNQYYSYCFISDAAGCCSQGLEFDLGKGHNEKIKKLKEKTEIEVVGTFETYYEGGKRFCRLRDAKLEKLSQ